jgi:hypothetical protein
MCILSDDIDDSLNAKNLYRYTAPIVFLVGGGGMRLEL